MAFLAGLRVFSIVFPQPLIVANAVTYGAAGTVPHPRSRGPTASAWVSSMKPGQLIDHGSTTPARGGGTVRRDR